MALTKQTQDIFNSLPHGILQDARTLIVSLEKVNTPSNGVIDFILSVPKAVEEMNTRNKKKGDEYRERYNLEMSEKAPRCPKCQSTLMLRPNQKRGSIWICSSQKCSYKRETKNSADVELSNYGITPPSSIEYERDDSLGTPAQQEIFQSFGPQLIRKIVGILSLLKESKISGNDIRNSIISHVENVHSKIKERIKRGQPYTDSNGSTFNSKIPKCPRCKSPLMIREIMAPLGVKNKNGYKSEWYCINDKTNCTYEEYSTRTIQEELSHKGVIPPYAIYSKQRMNEYQNGQSESIMVENKQHIKSSTSRCHGCG